MEATAPADLYANADTARVPGSTLLGADAIRVPATTLTLVARLRTCVTRYTAGLYHGGWRIPARCQLPT